MDHVSRFVQKMKLKRGKIGRRPACAYVRDVSVLDPVTGALVLPFFEFWMGSVVLTLQAVTYRRLITVTKNVQNLAKIL